MDDDKGGKNVNDIGTTGSVNGSTPVSIVFDNPIGTVNGTAFRGNDRFCGPHYFDISFNITEENYQAGLEIVATITDGVTSREVTFVMPTIPMFENE